MRLEVSGRDGENIYTAKLWKTLTWIFLDIFVNARIYTTERASSVEQMMKRIDDRNWPELNDAAIASIREMVQEAT